VPGEGFLGTSPDGTRYWFNHLVYTTADSMTKPSGQAPEYKSAWSDQQSQDPKHFWAQEETRKTPASSQTITSSVVTQCC
jgi:hypothetical protein